MRNGRGNLKVGRRRKIIGKEPRVERRKPGGFEAKGGRKWGERKKIEEKISDGQKGREENKEKPEEKKTGIDYAMGRK